MGTLLGVILFLILSGIFISGLRIAREYQRAVVFRLGRYNALRGPGLFWLIPLGIENETRIDLRVVTNPIEQQETITRDSVTVKVNAVLWFRVNDPKKAVLTVRELSLSCATGGVNQPAKRNWAARSRRSVEGAPIRLMRC